MFGEIQDRDRDDAHWIEVREVRSSHRERWSIRAAQWRGLELAREIFGDSVVLRSEGFPPRGGFQGLVHLTVPFDSLEAHRTREARFAGLVGADELLARVPLVFVFEPQDVNTPVGRLS